MVSSQGARGPSFTCRHVRSRCDLVKRSMLPDVEVVRAAGLVVVLHNSRHPAVGSRHVPALHTRQQLPSPHRKLIAHGRVCCLGLLSCAGPDSQLLQLALLVFRPSEKQLALQEPFVLRMQLLRPLPVQVPLLLFQLALLLHQHLFALPALGELRLQRIVLLLQALRLPRSLFVLNTLGWLVLAGRCPLLHLSRVGVQVLATALLALWPGLWRRAWLWAVRGAALRRPRLVAHRRQRLR
mmetsp:Transcript_50613/g.117526  ORF Transcript_50613/g.117526 Transcript_50613/m.117526 type:complete len:239 (-) Transcript_50613:102-818(-)